MSICYIVGAMPDPDVVIQKGFVIAADKGVETLQKKGVLPDLIVGDFDSLGYVPAGENTERHPSEKDDTDMLLALRRGMEKGCDTFVLYGGMGGRLDHTLANLQTLLYAAKRGKRAYLVGDGIVATAIYNEALVVANEEKNYVSVFAAEGDAEGVCLSHLKYTLQNARLTADFPLGVSNESTGEVFSVSVEKGALCVLWHESPVHLMERLMKEEAV